MSSGRAPRRASAGCRADWPLLFPGRALRKVGLDHGLSLWYEAISLLIIPTDCFEALPSGICILYIYTTHPTRLRI